MVSIFIFPLTPFIFNKGSCKKKDYLLLSHGSVLLTSKVSVPLSTGLILPSADYTQQTLSGS